MKIVKIYNTSLVVSKASHQAALPLSLKETQSYLKFAFLASMLQFSSWFSSLSLRLRATDACKTFWLMNDRSQPNSNKENAKKVGNGLGVGYKF